ncbi:c-type cytochrome [Rufibacter quisquiliarum]|uniref:Cytochrome c n=1 Tax=Rufibacter quisquiliarum TaxID=1549639 RepID=A0A839GLK9_9BACT|nr:c-type cytochrome [Rufibacter quisquiliarum]MBA9079722.1 cytochrome c [Rufibacter quisquiliarum]
MKKLVLLFACCALFAACDSKSSTENAENSEINGGDAADLSAATRQPSDVDTNAMNIGTDRSDGGGGTALPDAEKGAKLIAQSDCTACHRNDQKLVGPAYEEVAQKYEANEKNIDYLAGKIIEGGKGVWGEVPMTPHPGVSEADAKAMAQYVLSLKK